MRGLLGIAAIVVVVLALGWTKPLKEWVLGPAPKPIEAKRVVEVVPPPVPKPASGSWMWDKERKTVLDQRSYNRDYNVAHSAELYSTSAHVDSNGNRYWVDQSGGRHYY